MCVSPSTARLNASPITLAAFINAQRSKRTRLKQELTATQQEAERLERRAQQLFAALGIEPIRDMDHIDAHFPDLVPNLIRAGDRQIEAELALLDFESTRHVSFERKTAPLSPAGPLLI